MNKIAAEKLIMTEAVTLPSDFSFETISAECHDEWNVLCEKMYELYYDRIHRYLSFRLSNKSDADDLAQTVFLKMFTALKRGIWDGTRDICYIFTIARNTLIDHFRRGKHAVIISDELLENIADSNVTSEPIENREREELIRNAMNFLRGAEVEAVTFRFFADMEYPAIAKLMGKREEAVRQLVHRGLKSLRTHITI